MARPNARTMLSPMSSMNARVAVTGLGVVSALGVGMNALWDGLCAGRTGLVPITRFDASGFPSGLAGEIKDFSAKEFVPKSYRKAIKVMARDIEIAVACARLAVDDAGLLTRNGAPDAGEAPGPSTYPGPRMGCHIGAGLIAAETDELTNALATSVGDGGNFDLRAWGTAEGGRGGMNNLPPLWLLKYLPNMLACHVTILHGAEGPSNTITCSEASGLLSLGESVRVIERGAADLCFSGGAESKLNLMGMLRMQLAGRLASTAGAGAEVVRPYDPAATGSLLGEGGGILIVERLESAKSRGAKCLAEIVGFGAAQSGRIDFRQGPEPDDGLRDAIEAALADAGVGPGDIDAIVPHAVGVANLDRAEAGALRQVFGARLDEIEIVTLTPNIGDTIAGQGSIMAAVGAKILETQRLPARLHAGTPAGLRAGRAESRGAAIRRVLVCCSSLGGQNAALVLSRA